MNGRVNGDSYREVLLLGSILFEDDASPADARKIAFDCACRSIVIAYLYNTIGTFDTRSTLRLLYKSRKKIIVRQVIFSMTEHTCGQSVNDPREKGEHIGE